MTEKELKTLLTRRPFTPFRLHFSSGTSHDVTHPDGLIVNGRMAAVAVGDTLWFVSPIHIVEVEPLPAVSA